MRRTAKNYRILVAAVCPLAVLGCALEDEGGLLFPPFPQTGGAPPDGSAATGGALPGGAGGVSASGGSAVGGAPGSGGLSGTGGAAAQGGSGGGGSENCENGIDDNLDGRVDCADPDCTLQGYMCFAAPLGWMGYFRLNEMPYLEPQPPSEICPDGSSPARHYRLPTPTTQCATCFCGPWGGGQCGPAEVLCKLGGSTCSGAVAQPVVQEAAACADLDTTSLGMSHQLACQLSGFAPLLTEGACAPSPPPEVVNREPWGVVTDLCTVALSPGGCTARGVCASRGTGAYAGPLCVRADGDVPCPSGWDDRFVLHAGGVDQRACGACTCQVKPGSVGCHGGSYRFWDDAGCSNCSGSGCSPPRDVTSTACVDLSALADGGTLSVRRTQRPMASGGQCTALGGQPTGSVVPSGTFTLCCQ